MNNVDHMKQLIQLMESAEAHDYGAEKGLPTVTPDQVEIAKDLMKKDQEQSDSTIPDRARKIIATYSRQSGFKSPVEPDITKISGTPEQDLHTEIKRQLFKSYTRDPAFAGYVKREQDYFIYNLKKQNPMMAHNTAMALSSWDFDQKIGKAGEYIQGFFRNLVKKDATKYLTMYLQDTNLDHPVIA